MVPSLWGAASLIPLISIHIMIKIYIYIIYILNLDISSKFLGHISSLITTDISNFTFKTDLFIFT